MGEIKELMAKTKETKKIKMEDNTSKGVKMTKTDAEQLLLGKLSRYFGITFHEATKEQIYKAVVIDKEDAVKIASIISEQDIYNVDFVCETNISNKYILFIHISHLEEFVKKINEYNLNVVINPKIDEKIF